MGEWLKIGKIQFKLWCDMCDQTFANVFAYRYYKTSIFTIAQVHKYQQIPNDNISCRYRGSKKHWHDTTTLEDTIVV